MLAKAIGNPLSHYMLHWVLSLKRNKPRSYPHRVTSRDNCCPPGPWREGGQDPNSCWDLAVQGQERAEALREELKQAQQPESWGSRGRQLGSATWLCSVWSCTRLATLCLSFFICEMGMIITPERNNKGLLWRQNEIIWVNLGPVLDPKFSDNVGLFPAETPHKNMAEITM